MKFVVFLTATVLGFIQYSAVAAQDTPGTRSPNAPELVEFLKHLRAEVVSSGHITIDTKSSIGEFTADNAHRVFRVTFAVDRETMRRLQTDCPASGIYIGKAGMCHADISAELSFDGPELNLLVYEVRNIVK